MDYLTRFMQYSKSEKGLSGSTVIEYQRDIYKFLTDEGTPKNIEEITNKHVRNYLAKLDNEGKSRSTIHRTLYALKSFFKYLKRQEGLFKNKELPTDGISFTKRDKSLPKYISEEEIQAILEAAARTSLKDRLLVELMYGLGGRVSEIVELKVEDIDFDDCYVKIIGKGGKERHNPIHRGCIELIKLYMRAYGITSGYLFPSRFNPSRPMSRTNAWDRVKKLARKAGVDEEKVSPHVFRHSFATHMLERGCDMAVVQEFLGHENISTTRIYARVTRTSKKANFAQFHPLASNE